MCGADLREADLREADLCGADLREADLREASLFGAQLNGAYLNGVNLRGAQLCEANLNGAQLCEANLNGAQLNGANIDGEEISKTPLGVTGLRYWCLITNNYMRLGCERYTHAEWANFTDAEIAEMDAGALEFWNQWKEPLLAMCKSHRGEMK